MSGNEINLLKFIAFICAPYVVPAAMPTWKWLWAGVAAVLVCDFALFAYLTNGHFNGPAVVGAAMLQLPIGFSAASGFLARALNLILKSKGCKPVFTYLPFIGLPLIAWGLWQIFPG